MTPEGVPIFRPTLDHFSRTNGHAICCLLAASYNDCDVFLLSSVRDPIKYFHLRVQQRARYIGRVYVHFFGRIDCCLPETSLLCMCLRMLIFSKMPCKLQKVLV